jgi:cell division protein FtsB
MAMLGVLMVIVYLYVGAVRSYLATHHEAGRRQALIGRLERANSELRSRRTALRSPATLARDARALGMIRPGERAYVVTGLPSRVTPTP